MKIISKILLVLVIAIPLTLILTLPEKSDKVEYTYNIERFYFKKHVEYRMIGNRKLIYNV